MDSITKTEDEKMLDMNVPIKKELLDIIKCDIFESKNLEEASSKFLQYKGQIEDFYREYIRSLFNHDDT